MLTWNPEGKHLLTKCILTMESALAGEPYE